MLIKRKEYKYNIGKENYRNILYYLCTNKVET